MLTIITNNGYHKFKIRCQETGKEFLFAKKNVSHIRDEVDDFFRSAKCKMWAYLPDLVYWDVPESIWENFLQTKLNKWELIIPEENKI